MDELSIKVTIANRQYPLKIKRADEERVRKSAKMLNDRIKEYESQYAVSDKLDIMTMCAMQFASELVNLQEDHILDNEKSSTEIAYITKLIATGLKENTVQ